MLDYIEGAVWIIVGVVAFVALAALMSPVVGV